jgi:hypothetical protein
MRGYVINKEDYLKRLARIEGQVRGLRRMITEDKYCIDVLTQINSVNAALKGVAVGATGRARAPLRDGRRPSRETDRRPTRW